MELDAITPKLLERALRCWQHMEDPPDELLALHLLSANNSTSPTERFIQLHDVILSITSEALKRYRQTVGLRYSEDPASTRETLVNALTRDFAQVPKNKRLEAWSALYYQYMDSSLDLDVKDLVEVAQVQSKFFRRRVELGLRLLTDALRRAELEAHRQNQNLQLRFHLPNPEHSGLVGTISLVPRLVNLLNDHNGPRLISIEGLGGIGKTALAQAVSSAMANRGELVDILWISARQEWINAKGELEQLTDPARSLEDVLVRLVRQLGHERLTGLPVEQKLQELQPLLSGSPYLIVVDNLETVIDTQALVPALYRLSGATRFVLTSRETLQHFPYVHSVGVPELNQAESQLLIETELMRRKRKESLTLADMEAIYQVTGGVPLALKLTAAQIGKYPLAIILNELRETREQMPEMLFTYIYRRTWNILNDLARQLLLSMLDASPEGEDIQWLQQMSELYEKEFGDALAQLMDCSLIEVTGLFQEPQYRLHRLTATFLHTDILVRWG
jgi:hypothetical protein